MNGKAILLVGAGGATGTILRYSLYQILPLLSKWTTLLCNMTGAFLLAALYSYFAHTLIAKAARNDKEKGYDEKLKLFFGVGLLGSFTTFSAISMDLYHLLHPSFQLQMMLYIMFTFIGGFIATASGYLLVKHLVKRVRKL